MSTPTNSTTAPTVPFTLDAPHRRVLVGGEPMIFHCHHYNTFLQRSIEDAAYIESESARIGGAAEVAFGQLAVLFAREELDTVAERKAMAQELYRWAGFGTFDLSSITADGGTITTPNSHYAHAWKLKFGPHTAPVCGFASGWLAGALAAIFDLPLGSFRVTHPTCGVTSDAPDCHFEITRGVPNYRIFNSVGAGPLTAHEPVAVESHNVDYDGIFEALTGMEIVGDETGAIPAFGVHLTRHYANYYNRISFEFLKDVRAMFGDEGIEVAKSLFVEAGHVCAFNTFGGIMTSGPWDALIRPTLRTKEDWVHGMCAAVNALGWGRWQCTDVSRDGAEFILHDDYESTGYLAMYGKSDIPLSYLAEGAVVGTMNLIYEGHIEEKPTLDADFYLNLFRGQDRFKVECTQSQAMGANVTRLSVSR
jgi:hypothetical protein